MRYRIQHFVGTQDWCIARTLYRLERFNGLGYHAKGVNSPYIYGGSTLYGPTEAKAGNSSRTTSSIQPCRFPARHRCYPACDDVEDSSIMIDDSPSIAPRSEPDEDVASSVLLMQQTLNKLGANPPLDEDGISGPKTKAAVSQFQQQHALEDTGLLDGTTIAAITRAGVQPVRTAMSICPRSWVGWKVSHSFYSREAPTANADSDPTDRDHPGGSQPARSDPEPTAEPHAGLAAGSDNAGSTTPAANTPVSVLGQLLSLITKTAPGTATPANPAPADQLKQVVDLLSAMLSNKPVLGQVNGALGETIGKLLDGKKTALGIGGYTDHRAALRR